MTDTSDWTLKQLEIFSSVLWCPMELIEVRPLPPNLGRQVWVSAADLTRITQTLITENQAGANIHVGVLPRVGVGGSTDADCDPGRVVWADLDHVQPEEASLRVEQAGLPFPTLVIASGHGTHLYWRLSSPTPPADLSAAVKDVAVRLGADRSVSNPSRVMRLPGTYNHKAPGAWAHIFQVNVSLVYDFEVFHPISNTPQPAVVGTVCAVNQDGLRVAISEIAKMNGSAVGGRNNALYRVAATLVKDFAVPADEAFRLLLDWDKERNQPPLSLTDGVDALRTIIENAGRYGNQDVGCKLDPAPDIPVEEVNGFNTTDTGNGELLARRHGQKLRYDYRRKRWLIYEGHVWREPDCGELDRWATDAARLRYRAAGTIENIDERKQRSKWAIVSESDTKIEAALDRLKSILPVADNGDGWDENPDLLAVKNGVVDLRTGELRPGRPEDKITRQIRLNFDPSAKAPRWCRFVPEIFGGDDDLVCFAQLAVGYSMTGHTREQVLFFPHGKGSNGKSAFIETVKYIFGPHAQTTSFATFEQARPNAGAASPDVASLEGARLVHAAEASESLRLNEARVKALTGCDTMPARKLYCAPYTFKPVCKIWLCANHLPRVHDDSHGFWRRVRLVPFNVIFDPTAEPGLEDTLRNEAQGILAWIVRGAVAWYQRGLTRPEAVMKATEEYKEESDVLSDWLEQSADLDPGKYVRAKDAFDNYRRWTEMNNVPPREQLTQTAFGRRMGMKFNRVKTRDGWIYWGLALKVVPPVTGLPPFFTNPP